MDTELKEYLKEFLKKNDIDGLIINSTNEFLVEYNMLNQNSRYHVTGFTGSTGDVLFTEEKMYLFVDTRYHEQADKEVNKEETEVIKIPLNKSYLTALTEIIPGYFKLGITGKKISKKFFDELQKKLQEKNSIIKVLSIDPVTEYLMKSAPEEVKYNVFNVKEEITGLSADQKYEMIKEYAGEKFNIAVTSLEDIAYITNLRSYDFNYSSIFPAKAIINEEGVKIYSDCKLPEIGKNYVQLPLKEYENDLRNIQKSIIYTDEDKISVNDFKQINQSNKISKSYLNLFKTVKNDNEISHLKNCFERADNSLRVINDMLLSETIYSEYEYYEALVESMKSNGALSLSFKPIVAGGSNSSIIHYTNPSKSKRIENGDFLLIDYGGYYEGGYATDTTRTFVKGEPSSDQKTVYTAVLKAFLNAYFNKYNKKSTYFDIDKTARETIEKSLSEEYKFAHATGHGVGISVHENPPRVTSKDISKTKIKKNTVFSIEPGAYKEGWGGVRLENTVYADTDENNIIIKTFSHFPFEIKLVDLSMMNDYEKYYYMKWQAGACIL